MLSRSARKTIIVHVRGILSRALHTVSTPSSSSSFSLTSSSLGACTSYPFHVSSSFFSTVSSAQDRLAEELHRLEMPRIAVSASHIQPLYAPQEFYDTLLHMISRAKRRIVLSALYLGTDSASLKLVEEIQSAVQRHPDLQATFALDFNRAQRKERNGESIYDILNRTFQYERTARRVRVHLIRAGKHQATNGKAASKVRELAGVHHMKMYVCDDDVMLTGANLSSIYFEKRQDRYVLFKNSPELANVHVSLLELLISSSSSSSSSATSAAVFKQQLRDICNNNNNGDSKRQHDTYVYPALQVPNVQISQASDAVLSVLQNGHRFARMTISTGYFNLLQSHIACLRHGNLRDTRIVILAAGHNANGFAGASFPLSLVPKAYDVLWKQAQTELKRQTNIQWMLYEKPGWSYHAKGIWMNNNSHDSNGEEGAVVSVVGSSNFGQRSQQRDTENISVIVTHNTSLQQLLVEEEKRLTKECVVDDQENKKKKENIYPIVLEGAGDWLFGSLVAWLIRVLRVF